MPQPFFPVPRRSLGWRMDDPRKGREPGFTLSSSKQLVVQTRRAIFGRFLLLKFHKSAAYSNLTPPLGIFLVLDAAALGFAAATLHLRNKPAPLYESNDVVTSTLLPVVVTAIDGLWVAALCVFHRVSHRVLSLNLLCNQMAARPLLSRYFPFETSRRVGFACYPHCTAPQ